MPALVDTNVLVYRFDHRFPEKQAKASKLLRGGIEDGTLRIPHQAIVEFVAATTRSLRGAEPLLALADALREAEELLRQFPVIYPDAAVLRTAFRGTTMYQLSWFDAHLWACAEVNALDTLYSEDFQHGRYYGLVRAVDPFQGAESP